MTWIFEVSIRRPPRPITIQRQSVVSALKAYVSTLVYRLLARRSRKISRTCLRCLSGLSEDQDVIEVDNHTHVQNILENFDAGAFVRP